MKVIGRIAWDESNVNSTPWCSFANITEYRTWAREMRRALGGSRKIKAEYHCYDMIWSPESLLERARSRSEEVDPTPCCADPDCNGNPCTFPGYADNH